jgi:hypothetical protein
MIYYQMFLSNIVIMLIAEMPTIMGIKGANFILL